VPPSITIFGKKIIESVDEIYVQKKSIGEGLLLRACPNLRAVAQGCRPKN